MRCGRSTRPRRGKSWTGCRPGSWLQYVARVAGPGARLVGLDRTPLDITVPGCRVLVGDVFDIEPPELLGPLDLAVPRARTLAVVGPSGAGKTTLLRLLLGLERPDEGEVRFGGVPLADLDVLALRRRIGYVVQGGGLFPHLTAEGNASLVARWLAWDETAGIPASPS